MPDDPRAAAIERWATEVLPTFSGKLTPTVVYGEGYDAGVAAAEAELHTHKQRADWAEDFGAECQDALNKVEAQNARLRAALRKYGQHKRGCPSHPDVLYSSRGNPDVCDCGLRAALEDTPDA